MHANKFVLTALIALSVILGGCYTDDRFGYHVQGSISEPAEPWRMISGPEANNVSSNLEKPGLAISFYMGAKWKQTHDGSWKWDSYRAVGRPFPVAILVTGGVWTGQDKFDGITLDEKKVFFIRQGERIPARLIFATYSKLQLEFDTELRQNDRFQLVLGDGLRSNNQVIEVPVISFEGDRGHSATRSLSDMFVSH